VRHGTAYLVSGDLAKTDPLQAGPSGWRTARMTKIYDLSDPAKPVFVRDFGLAGQEPGSSAASVPPGAHGPIALGNRVYFRVRDERRRPPADRGSPEAPERAERAHRGEPQRARDQPALHVAELGSGTRPSPCSA
jgi:hypothetical protein